MGMENMTIGNKQYQMWPKLKDSCIGYDAHSSYEYFLSDNPNFTGFEGKGFNKDFAHKVEYHFNEFGHRSEIPLSENHFLVVGGSQTFGIGVPVGKTYAEIIAKRLGMEYYNLSLPGTSHDVNIFNLIWYLSRRNPAFVLWEWLFDTRNCLLLEDKNYTVLPLISMMVEKQEEVFDIRGLTDFFVSSNDVGYNRTRRIMHEGQLDNLAKANNTTIHQYNFNGSKDYNKWKQLDIGRDGEHFGIETHESIAEQLMDTFTSRSFI